MRKNRIKLAIIFGVEFIAIAVVLLLIFFAGKKSYTVTFDLNGGILLNGDLVQEVRQGGSATPPNVAKDGCYLHSWSASYQRVTRDVTVRAVWEYETTEGIEYSTDRDGYDSNYCEITGSFPELRGDVYLGAYHDERKVLGIRAEAFKGRTGIERVYMLDGILSIGEETFAGCTSLESIVLPNTLAVIAKGAFRDCVSLKSITIPASVEYIDDGAFEGCTSLEEIIFLTEERVVEAKEDEDAEDRADEADEKPSKGKDKNKGDEEKPETYLYSAVESIGARAFAGCVALEKVTLPERLAEIGEGAFAGCEALVEILIPESVEKIGVGAFDTPEMSVNILIKEADKPEGWVDGWYADVVTVVWEYTEETEPDTPIIPGVK